MFYLFGNILLFVTKGFIDGVADAIQKRRECRRRRAHNQLRELG